MKALRTLGFTDKMIEVSDTPLTLKGYHGDDREQKANIRIKGSGWGSNQNYVGGASNDLGFEKMSDGSWAFHVSDYDKSKYDQSWTTKLLNQYGLEVVKEVATEQNFFVESVTNQSNEIHVRLTTCF